MRKTHFLPLLAALLAAAPGAAQAGDPLVCDAPHDLDRYQLLRRLSLDLRGSMPSIDEYDALDTATEVPAAKVQEYLESDDFRLAMRRYHEAMFWPNINAVRLHNVNATLSSSKDVYAYRITSSTRTKLYRGASDEGCGDFQQKHFDPNFPGEFRPDPAFVKTDAMTGAMQEGWRVVAPYWDPTNPIQVCAFDAQETVSDTVKGKMAACNTPNGNLSAACGCGKDLRYCYVGAVDTVIHGALREQLGRSVDKVTSGGKPYTDLVLSTEADENGPIAFWKNYLAPNLSTSVAYDAPDPGETIAPIDDFLAGDTWKTVDRGPKHAGVLTLPAYLLRFQTNRGRANRFRIDFMNQYFIPPDQLEPQPGCDANANDLTQRCNCQYCHSTLEPMAAHFAGFVEAGTTRMSDEAVFPKTNKACASLNPSSFCARFYVTAPDAHNAGTLIAWQYADVHDDYAASIDAGPAVLAQQIIDDGTFAASTVKKVFAFFLKRDPILDGGAFDEAAVIDTLSKGFVAQKYDFRWLVQQVVSLRQYRRAR
jgi:hypothetical protein